MPQQLGKLKRHKWACPSIPVEFQGTALALREQIQICHCEVRSTRQFLEIQFNDCRD